MPAEFSGKIQVLAANLASIHWPTALLAVGTTALIGLWPARLSRYVPGARIGIPAGVVSNPDLTVDC